MKEISQPLPTIEVVRLACKALDDKKAEGIRALYVGAQSSITDYLVIATGTSDPHLRALRVELEKVLDAAKVRILGMDTDQGSGWLVVDAFDVMIHMFTGQTRENYKLETLWKDAEDMDVAALLSGADVKPGQKKAVAKKVVKKTGVKTVKKPVAKTVESSGKKVAAKKAPSKKAAHKKAGKPSAKPKAKKSTKK